MASQLRLISFDQLLRGMHYAFKSLDICPIFRIYYVNLFLSLKYRDEDPEFFSTDPDPAGQKSPDPDPHPC